jgi:glycine/D-amino acid oxidase-like deaminating enzyme
MVLIAAGSWSAPLVPGLWRSLRSTGHAVFHLRPRRRAEFDASVFPVFTADIAHTGFYGFPLHPRAGVVKLALHDAGLPIDPHVPRSITRAHLETLRGFLPQSFPTLADAELVFTRLCLYSDTASGHFLIDRHPRIEGLCVAAGGSGHAFKFAPLLGRWIADAALGVGTVPRFAWREASGTPTGDAARCNDGPPSRVF